MAQDYDLIRQCIKGQTEAFGKLYDRYAPVLLSVCLRYLPVRAEAEDILQECFIRIFEKIGEFKVRPEASFEGWMKRIVVNKALNHIRDKNRNRLFVEGSDPGMWPDVPDDEPGSGFPNVTADEVHQMIQKLPDGYRTVFNLYVMEEYGHKEIAAMLGCSENTSKTQLLKARNMLKKRIVELQNTKEHV
ncbi:MAG TPA: RNA polymerase subunit sigma-70 [Bacteroidales bacterium]|nr:MAG: hypothetical protein A2X11_03580 [Bacteroidetes bacterium GWE2_42_24]OFY32695.1 MAG: hypothetical protein A2X09_06540 [Bacteroidetes bacterium GWF2_43_11]HAQ66135.1 RNA polymerase subunit sigma-70 [Bacteroidales bacterium]HBZ65219.1 RNA polymerase subunit sigma-70 [Bacteroidales bacterium]